MPDDTHAIYVYLAMKQKGHNSLLWYTADFPTQQKHIFEINQNITKWTVDGVNFSIQNQNIDIVWFRRPRAPILSPDLHIEDIKNSEKENRALFRGLWNIIAPKALWVNSNESSKKAACKMLQLEVARNCGLNIPRTLISNDPIKIKKFISTNKFGGTIYKTFNPLAWKPPSNSLHLTYTNVVTEDSLPSDCLLQSTPGIFQEKINKAYELRITYFGVYPVAVKLYSQEHPDGQFDWRAITDDKLKVDLYDLPKDIDDKCRMLMTHFGLLFGCFDFIVTPSNEYYFLEINEQGQFLWIEQLNSNIKMLDIFTQFLINKNENFQYQETEKSISIRDFSREVHKLKEAAIKSHLIPEMW